jgi:hypothetical protein
MKLATPSQFPDIYYLRKDKYTWPTSPLAVRFRSPCRDAYRSRESAPFAQTWCAVSQDPRHWATNSNQHVLGLLHTISHQHISLKTSSIMLRRTIVVRTDVKTSSLASCDSLWQTKQRSSQCPNAIFEKNRSRVHGGSGAWDLDAEPIFGNADLLELTSVTASMCNHFLCIICVERRGLEEDPPLDVIDVLGAKENAL